MELLFNLITVVCFGAATYFYSLDQTDRMFFAIVLAICSFFLSFRFRIKKRLTRSMDDQDS